MQTHALTHPNHNHNHNPNLNFWHFNLGVNAFREPAMDYISTDYGFSSSSCFPFRARIHSHKLTDITEYPTHAMATSGIGKKQQCL